MEWSAAQTIALLLKVGVLTSVFALGLHATLQDTIFLMRRPVRVVRAVLAMYILTPLLAVLLVQIMPAPPAVKVAVLLMAISAGAPLLSAKLLKLGGDPRYAYSLSFITTLLAMLTVPLSLSLLSAYLGTDVHVPPREVAALLAMVLLLPLLAGMLVHWLAPVLARRIREPLINLAGILLLALGLLIVIVNLPAIMAIGPWGMALIVLMTAASLAIGYFVGGPDGDGSLLAVACATRFPGLGLLVASLNFPNARPLPVVVAFLLFSNIVVIFFLFWRKKKAQ